MAITTGQIKKLNAVHIISSKDSAVDEDASDWELYSADPIKNLDAVKYKAGQEATHFICNFEQSGKEMATIKDAMLKGFDDDRNPQLSYGNGAYTVARFTLKDIQNPPNVADTIVFKKEGRGYVADSVLTVLDRLGVVQEIFQHWVKLTQDDTEPEAKN